MSYKGIRKMEFAGHVLRGSSVTMYNEIIEGYIRGKRDKGGQVEPGSTI